MDKKDNTARRRVVVEEVDSAPDVVIEETVIVSESTEPQTEFVSEPVIDSEPQTMPEESVSEPVPQQPTRSMSTDFEEYRVSKGPGPLVIIVPGILLLGALLGGIVFYQNSLKNETPLVTSTPEVVVSASPTATPASTTVDTSKYSVAIQNGSGVKGEAGKVQDLLEAADFKVSTTGNAATYDYTETVIQAKSTVDKGFLDKLNTTLSKTYKVATKVESLASTSKDEVVVIVGSSKK